MSCNSCAAGNSSPFGEGSAPVYKTPFVGGYGAGLTGAVGGISQSFSAFGNSYAPPAPSFSAPLSSPLPDFSSGFAASSFPAPAPASGPSFGASFGAAGFSSSFSGGFGFDSSSFGGGSVSVAPPIHLTAPPQIQYLEAPPPMSIEAPPLSSLSACCPPPPVCPPPPPICSLPPPPPPLCCPPPPPPVCLPPPPPICCPQYVEAPPVVLQLPAPCPPPPCPLPPPPSVIHIKDDSGPKIASLQAEIRRLERLLAAARETEAGMRAELAELQTRLEIMQQKEAQHAACEAEVAKLREQLLEAQRRITFLEGQRDEAHKHIAFLENQLKAADGQIAQMAARIRQLEQEIANLQTRLQAKQEVRSQTNVHETYKVKSFEIAAKLAVMDGTDDGMYNGLPIEVEGEGLYKDLVARGRRPRENVSLTGRPASVTTTSETYKVQSFEMAEKLSKMDGTDDGRYNGLPIEVAGEGLYTDLVRQGRRSAGSIGGGGFAQGSFGGGFGGGANVSIGGGAIGSMGGGQTYKVSNMEMAAKISKMGGADDGTYKGLPIEVSGMGLYRDLRGRM